MVDDSQQMLSEFDLTKTSLGPDEFAALLSRHTELIRETRNMRSTKRIGMLMLEAKKFAKSVLPFPQVRTYFSFLVIW